MYEDIAPEKLDQATASALRVLVDCITMAAQHPMNHIFKLSCVEMRKSDQFKRAENVLRHIALRDREQVRKEIVIYDPPHMMDHEVIRLSVHKHGAIISSDGCWSGIKSIPLNPSAARTLSQELQKLVETLPPEASDAE